MQNTSSHHRGFLGLHMKDTFYVAVRNWELPMVRVKLGVQVTRLKLTTVVSLDVTTWVKSQQE